MKKQVSEKKPIMVEITEYPCGCVVCKDKIIRRCLKHENYGKEDLK